MSSPMRAPWPKAILFDLDTLWPIEPVIRRAEVSLHAWLADHAPRVTERFSIDVLRQRRLELLARQPEFQLDLGALRRTDLAEAFEQAGEDTAKVEAAMTAFFAARNAVIPYDDVLPGLLRLKGRALLGSVTNGNADLRAIGLEHHFKVSVAANQVGVAKPDPAIFHAACARLGVAPREAVFVGDDILLDVQGAQRAGMRAVWLRRAGRSAPDGHGVEPDAVCTDLRQLYEWLHANHAPA